MGTLDLLGTGEKTLHRNREMRGIAGARVKGWPRRCEVATTGIEASLHLLLFVGERAFVQIVSIQ